LFLAVFNRYCDGRVELVDGIVRERADDFESTVANYLDAIVADCTSYDDRRGCLMLNSLADLGSRYPEIVTVGNRTISAMEKVIGDRVAETVASGEIDLSAAEVEALSAHIVLVSQGLISLSHIGVPRARLSAIAATSSRMTSLLGSASSR
jgi:AcrR family transcriptional regulator